MARTMRGLDLRPVRIYEQSDPRSRLPPRPEGYPEDHPVMTPVPIPATDITGGLDIEPSDPTIRTEREALADRGIRPRRKLSPELERLIAGVGDIADRAQESIESQPPATGPGPGAQGMVARAAEEAGDAAKGAGRKPLTPAGRSEPPPLMAGFASPEEQQKVLDFARQKAGLVRGAGKLGQTLSGAADLYTGRSAPKMDLSTEAEAGRIEGSADDQLARAKEFALRRLGLQRQEMEDARTSRQDAFQRERLEAQEARADETAAARQAESEADRAFRREEAEKARAFAARQSAKARAAASSRREEKESFETTRRKRQLVEVQDRYNNITSQIGELKKMIDAGGTQEIFGPHNKIMSQRINSIAVDMAKLVDPDSVARESEVENFKRMLFEPGFWQQEETMLGVLGAFKKMVDERLAGAYQVRGIDPSEVPAGGVRTDLTTTPIPPAPFQGAKRVRDPQGRVGWWDGVSQLPEGVEVLDG